MSKKIDVDESLAKIIHAGLNEEGLETFLLGEEENPADIKDFVSTGIDILDLAISNRPRGGIACGRLTELNGLQGTGKSLIAAHMMANVQKEGGVACLLDTENAVNEEFFRAIGLNINDLVYRQPKTVEEIFETIETIIEIVRKKNKIDKKVIIVVDSITAAPTKSAIEANYDKQGYPDKARIISDALTKIVGMIGRNKIALVCTNQLRMKMNAPAFSDPYTISGGLSMPFYMSTRVRLTMKSKLKNKEDDVIGVRVNAYVEKNRIASPYKRVDFDIYFDRGVDNDTSNLAYLRKRGIIDKTKYVDNAGKEWRITEPDWPRIITEHPDLYAELYQKMCDAMISSYRSVTVDGEVLTTGDEGGVVMESGEPE